MIPTTVMALRTLSIDLNGYWHAGGGRSSGHHVDAMCERDETSLPILPGKQLKGLLRHAVRRAEAWNWLGEIPVPHGPATSHEELLFGTASGEAERSQTHPGVLLVGSAQLPSDDRVWLASPAGADIAQSLFDAVFSTAINERGSALDHSLRGMEVALPCELQAELAVNATALDQTRRGQQSTYIGEGLPWKVLEAVMPLLDHIGAHRSRGFGESLARLSAREED